MKSFLTALLLASCATDPNAPFKEDNIAYVSVPKLEGKVLTFYPINGEITYNPKLEELSFNDPNYGHVTLLEPFHIIYE